MTGLIELLNGRIVTPTAEITDGRVVLVGDRVDRVDETAHRPLASAETIDLDGQLVLPGIVDLHGDDVESQLHPRSDARVDVQTALAAADRTNLLNGVTTKFHAIAFEESPEDDRSLDDAVSLAREIGDASYTVADNRLHARCELTSRSVDAVERLDEAGIDLVSVMHHAPDDGQYDADQFERHYLEDRQWSPESVERIADERASVSRADREGLISRIAEVAADAGVSLASHDDDSAAAVDRMAEHGASISEYPLSCEAARRATEQGMTTAMGAPNHVRGGSLWDNLSVREAIDEDLVDVLCSDYHPPSLLASVFVDTGEPLPTRVNRVTRNPAEAVGLHDRGRIESGARADLIVVDPGPPPTVERVFVGGKEVFAAGRASSSGRTDRTRKPLRGPGS